MKALARCCAVILLLNLAVTSSSTEYKYDPNSIPHTSIQKLKNFISSGNEEVLVFFYGDFKECKECQELLPKFHEAVEYLNKLDDGKVACYKVAAKFPEYGINKVPELVLFLGDTPFVYDGKGREESWEVNDVLEWVEEAKQTPMQELTDETFEHLTQASTGATTGDWVIFFGDRSRPECFRPYLSTMGTVGLRMRMRKNVALVATNNNPVTSERFQTMLQTCASVLYFHRTELYKVPVDDFTVSSILYFITEGFQTVEHMEVPKVKTEAHPQLEDVIKTVSSFIEDYGRTHSLHASLLLLIIVIMFCVIVFLVKKFKKRKVL